MKKATSILLAIIIIMSFPGIAYAQTTHPADCGHEHDEYEYVEYKKEYEKEIVVEVGSEEEFLNYPRNPNYKYTFVMPTPQTSRSNNVCYMCGNRGLGLTRVREEGNIRSRVCPIQGWGSDHMTTWWNTEIERCTFCSYRVTWRSADTYTAWCRQSDRNWEVRLGWTMKNGYDLHQSLNYWLYGDMT